MLYLISQMIICLLIAFLLGLLLGWLLFRACSKNCKRCDDRQNDHYVPTNNVAPTKITPPPSPVVTAPVVSSSFTSTAAPAAATIIDLDSKVNLAGDGYVIETLQGIGPKTGNQMRDLGMPTIESFLRNALLPQQRKKIADQAGVRSKMVDGWASMSDLLRVEGIDHQFAELLYKADILSVEQLASQHASTLTNTLETVNNAGSNKISPTLPVADEVRQWISQASGMKAIITLT